MRNKVFKFKKKKADGQNGVPAVDQSANSVVNQNTNQASNQNFDATAEVCPIIHLYSITPEEYCLEPDFVEWKKNYVKNKDKELADMNVDIENVELYYGEIKAKIDEQTNLSRNQQLRHMNVIRDILRRIDGKIVRCNAQKKHLVDDIAVIDARLDKLEAVKDSLENMSFGSHSRRNRKNGGGYDDEAS